MDTTRSDVAHLYRRAGFGGRPAELDAAASAGYQATVDSLLAGLGPAPDPAGDGVVVPTFAPFQVPTGAPGTPGRLAANKALLASFRQELYPLQEWWLNRMIVTSTPLREKMTLLWHGHFATAVSKVRDPNLMYLQNQLFRRAGGGSFEDLTQAVAKDGAMMVWLDTSTDKKAHPNENFSRELMELFTLGVGSYSQGDVEAAAAAFSGWTYERATNQWALRPAQHDGSTVTFLGQSGQLSGEEVISIILAQPASARFVVAKVWSQLAYPVSPADPVVDDLLGAYTPSYDIAGLLRAVFMHPGFLSPPTRTGLVKQPIEYVVGAARALRLDAGGEPLDPASAMPVAPSGRPVGPTLVTAATALAQTPFDPPNVGGWPQNEYWLNTATALARLRVAGLMVARADLSAVDATPTSQRPALVAQMLGLDPWGPTTAAALAHVASDAKDLVALALNAPEYVLN